MYAPNTLYAATKHAFQDILFFYRERRGVRSVSLILYDTFGENDTRPRFGIASRTRYQEKPCASLMGARSSSDPHQRYSERIFPAAELLQESYAMEPLYSLSSPFPVKLSTLVEDLATPRET